MIDLRLFNVDCGVDCYFEGFAADWFADVDLHDNIHNKVFSAEIEIGPI